MGLKLSHGIPHISYSRFHVYRMNLAHAIGIELDEMEGYGGQTAWESLPPDPLHVLLNHSDCEGDIEHQHLKALAERLSKLLDKLPEDEQTLSEVLIQGLKDADLLGEDLRFF